MNSDQQGGDARETVTELLPGYVLGVLDDDERLLVASELASSPSLRAEYERYQAVVDDVLLTVPVTEPADTLRQRVLSAAAPASPSVPDSIRGSRVFRGLAAVAALLILILGGTVVLLIGEVRERDDRIYGLQSAARQGTDFTQPLVWSTIGASGPGSQGWGYFCRTEDGNVGWIIVDGMHTDEDYIYQLWLVDDERVLSGGIFDTDHEGRGFGVVRVGAPLHTFREIWITIEPPGGSPSPSSEPDLTAPIV